MRRESVNEKKWFEQKDEKKNAKQKRKRECVCVFVGARKNARAREKGCNSYEGKKVVAFIGCISRNEMEQEKWKLKNFLK